MTDSWLVEAPCNRDDTDPMWWFPGYDPSRSSSYDGRVVSDANVWALQQCVQCPVQAECRDREPDFSFSRAPLQVIWGGRVWKVGGRGHPLRDLRRCVVCGRRVPGVTGDGACLTCAAGVGSHKWVKV